jgi:hypothetical protein
MRTSLLSLARHILAPQDRAHAAADGVFSPAAGAGGLKLQLFELPCNFIQLISALPKRLHQRCRPDMPK